MILGKQIFQNAYEVLSLKRMSGMYCQKFPYFLQQPSIKKKKKKTNKQKNINVSIWIYCSSSDNFHCMFIDREEGHRIVHTLR